MPGLFGILAKTPRLTRQDLLNAGKRMAAAMSHVPWLRTEIWSDTRFCGAAFIWVL
ncbi:MAG TPA: hypothetical protein VNL14_18715 [Candidatus Acidoferrales bacterium]|nr:hypothetical protein [Candidatus Acidoferrales bacterium]